MGGNDLQRIIDRTVFRWASAGQDKATLSFVENRSKIESDITDEMKP